MRPANGAFVLSGSLLAPYDLDLHGKALMIQGAISIGIHFETGLMFHIGTLDFDVESNRRSENPDGLIVEDLFDSFSTQGKPLPLLIVFCKKDTQQFELRVLFSRVLQNPQEKGERIQCKLVLNGVRDDDVIGNHQGVAEHRTHI